MAGMYSTDQTIPARFIDKEQWRGVRESQDAYAILNTLRNECEGEPFVFHADTLIELAKSGSFDYLLHFVNSLVAECGCSMTAYRQYLKLRPAEKQLSSGELENDGSGTLRINAAGQLASLNLNGGTGTALAVTITSPNVAVSTVPMPCGTLTIHADGTVKLADD